MVACKATVTWSLAAAPEPQGEVIEKFRSQGVETKRFPDEVLAALRVQGSSGRRGRQGPDLQGSLRVDPSLHGQSAGLGRSAAIAGGIGRLDD